MFKIKDKEQKNKYNPKISSLLNYMKRLVLHNNPMII